MILECRIDDGDKSYIIELKHWLSQRVTKSTVTHFVEVVASENRDGGVLISTSGFGPRAFSGLTEVTRKRVRFAGKEKLIVLAQTYVKAELGLWSPPSSLPELHLALYRDPRRPRHGQQFSCFIMKRGLCHALAAVAAGGPGCDDAAVAGTGTGFDPR